MAQGDQLLKAYSLIKSTRDNIPEHYVINEKWVHEFNEAIEKIENSMGMDLEEFKVPRHALGRQVASSNRTTGETTYRDGLWCERAILLQKIDAVMNYFTGLQEERNIGFQTPD